MLGRGRDRISQHRRVGRGDQIVAFAAEPGGFAEGIFERHSAPENSASYGLLQSALPRDRSNRCGLARAIEAARF